MRNHSPIKKKVVPKFNQLSALQWQTINSGIDASAFHGQIVAYQTDTPYFGDQDKQLQTSATFFGYIDNYARTWREPEDRGPRIERILKPESTSGLCAITETMLNYEGPTASLRMRKATEAELAFLKQSIISGAAITEHAVSGAMQALGLAARKPTTSSNNFTP